MLKLFLRVWCILLVGIPLALANTQVASCIDAAGSTFSNESVQTFAVVGQGCPVGFTSSSSHLNYSGFLSTSIYNPNSDLDNDNVADENDPDDDNDGILDSIELTGTSFNPQTPSNPFVADSDDDGISDYAESLAGTNPTNAMSYLHFTAINNAGIHWLARNGYTYDVLAASTVSELTTNSQISTTITATDGVGVWEETQLSVTNANTGNINFYTVRVAP